MSYTPHSMRVSESAQALERDLQKRKQYWYPIKPFTILITGLFLMALLIVPIVRGSEIAEVLVLEVGMTFGMTVCIALLVAWVWWRFFVRTDTAANFMICLVLVISGVWSAGLTGPQQAKAKEFFHDHAGRHIESLKYKIIDRFD